MQLPYKLTDGHHPLCERFIDNLLYGEITTNRTAQVVRGEGLRGHPIACTTRTCVGCAASFPGSQFCSAQQEFVPSERSDEVSEAVYASDLWQGRAAHGLGVSIPSSRSRSFDSLLGTSFRRHRLGSQGQIALPSPRAHLHLRNKRCGPLPSCL